MHVKHQASALHNLGTFFVGGQQPLSYRRQCLAIRATEFEAKAVEVKLQPSVLLLMCLRNYYPLLQVDSLNSLAMLLGCDTILRIKWRSSMLIEGCDPHLIGFNYGRTGMTSKPLGLIIHIAEAPDLGAIFNWFNNPKQEITVKGKQVRITASAHFAVGSQGEVWQFVDTDHQAYAQGPGDPFYLSVENVGYEKHGKLSDIQLRGNAWLLSTLSQIYGFPLQLANSKGEQGLGYHAMFHSGDHTCPGVEIIGQRETILEYAKPILQTSPSGGTAASKSGGIQPPIKR